MTDGEGKSWLRVAVNAPDKLADPLGNYLIELGAEGLEHNPGSFPGEEKRREGEILWAYFPPEAEAQGKMRLLRQYAAHLETLVSAALPVAVEVELVAAEDWGRKWQEFFRPTRIGERLVVKPSWEEYVPEAKDVVITIDPAMAFGTGSHPTTRLCLRALEGLFLSAPPVKDARVLDVGCGTGILAIAAAKLGAGEVLGLDIDPEAVLAARQNAALNGVREVRFLDCPVFALAPSFNIILANLTASPLIELRSSLVNLLARGGHLVVSGVLVSERERMEREFLGPPLEGGEIFVDEDWLCFVCKKAP